MFSPIKTILFLRNFDLFGIRPTLYFDGKRRSGTGFGFCLTVFLIIFSCICIGYFGQDLYYRENPSIRSHKDFQPLPEKVIYDPELTPVMIELNSPFGDVYYTDPKIIKMTVSQLTISKTENTTNLTLKEYPMEICRNDHFDKIDPEIRNYFLQKKLEDYFCIPKYLKNLTMQGGFDQSLFQNIKFTAYLCDNNTDDSCLSKEEISQQMSRGFIGIYFLDYTIDPGNYLIPTKTQEREVFTNFVVKSQKEIDVFFVNNYLESEDGVVFQSKSTQRYINYDSYTSFDFQTEGNDFLSVYFRLKQENNMYQRSYSKVQDLLAQIGGFINCFWIMAFLINYLYSYLIVVSSIIQTIFTIKIPKEGKEEAIKESVTLKTIEKKSCIKLKNLPNDLKDRTFDQIQIEMKKSSQIPEDQLVSPDTIPIKVPDEQEANNDLLSEPEKVLKQSQNVKTNEEGTPNILINSPLSSQRIMEIHRTQQMREDLKDYEVLENLNLGIFDYLHYYTGCFKSPERERKKIIIEKGSRILRRCLDIKYIIDKFYEIEKLKLIVLSEKEQEMFLRLPKPEIKIDYEDLKEKNKIRRRFTVNTNVFLKKVDLVENFDLKKSQQLTQN